MQLGGPRSSSSFRGSPSNPRSVGDGTPSHTLSAGSTEEMPLLGTRSSRCRRSIEHSPSLYSAMIFLPPLTKQRIGHYWSQDVMLAFVLLLMNVVVQLALTLIVGEHIVSQQHEYKATLLGESFAYTSPWTWLLNNAYESKPDIPNLKNIEGMPWANANLTADEDDAKCCNGHRCATSGMKCCNRVGAKPARPTKPIRKPTHQNVALVENASSFYLRKPKAKKKKEGQDGSIGDDDETSLCQMNAGNRMTCAPRSYAFLDAWSGLDTNEDGVWTLDEALADEANLGCHLGTPLEDIFRSNCRAVIQDVRDTNRHLEELQGHTIMSPFEVPFSIEEYEAVPQAFFNWWRGIVVTCIEADAAMCGQMVLKGVFDGAIGAEKSWTKGGVRDLDSALHYCQRLLDPGGICETAMPGYYQLYRSRVKEMCGKRLFDDGAAYTNPSNSRDVMQTVRITYENVRTVEEHMSYRYRFFLCMTLLLWYIRLLEELKEVVQWIDFLVCFGTDNTIPLVPPGMRENIRKMSVALSEKLSHISEEAAREEMEAAESFIKETEISESGYSDVSQHIVESISKLHWFTVFCITALRFWLLLYLFNVGTTFLLSNLTYLDLLLNAVALEMIFELPSSLYFIMMSDDAQEALDGSRTAPYESYLPEESWLSFLLSKFFWGCLLLPIMIFWAVAHNYHADLQPIYEALECACYQNGPRCGNAEKFTREWWNGYWTDVNGLFAASQSHGAR